jgi:hypothetical protein
MFLGAMHGVFESVNGNDEGWVSNPVAHGLLEIK